MTTSQNTINHLNSGTWWKWLLRNLSEIAPKEKEESRQDGRSRRKKKVTMRKKYDTRNIIEGQGKEEKNKKEAMRGGITWKENNSKSGIVKRF